MYTSGQAGPTYGAAPQTGAGFNSYGAGKKYYGGGRAMPNIGPTQDRLGYAVRDRREKAKQQLALQRMKVQNAQQMGMS